MITIGDLIFICSKINPHTITIYRNMNNVIEEWKVNGKVKIAFQGVGAWKFSIPIKRRKSNSKDKQQYVFDILDNNNAHLFDLDISNAKNYYQSCNILYYNITNVAKTKASGENSNDIDYFQVLYFNNISELKYFAYWLGILSSDFLVTIQFGFVLNGTSTRCTYPSYIDTDYQIMFLKMLNALCYPKVKNVKQTAWLYSTMYWKHNLLGINYPFYVPEIINAYEYDNEWLEIDDIKKYTKDKNIKKQCFDYLDIVNDSRNKNNNIEFTD